MAVSSERVAKSLSRPITRASVKAAIVHFARPDIQLILLVLLARWDDAEIGIVWPVSAPIVSGKDAAAGTLQASVAL